MASLPVYDASGSEVGKYEIDPDSISANINKQLLHDVVVMYQASARQGTHKTKSRSEVACTGKKMYRQKGTGNARAGSKACCDSDGFGWQDQGRPGCGDRQAFDGRTQDRCHGEDAQGYRR